MIVFGFWFFVIGFNLNKLLTQGFLKILITSKG
jgi:hypothetical protein